jgi:hypothetical protein
VDSHDDSAHTRERIANFDSKRLALHGGRSGSDTRPMRRVWDHFVMNTVGHTSDIGDRLDCYRARPITAHGRSIRSHLPRRRHQIHMPHH